MSEATKNTPVLQQTVEKVELARFRFRPGFMGAVQRTLLILLTLTSAVFALDLASYFGQVMFKQQAIGLFIGLTLASVFLGIPARKGRKGTRPAWYDLLLAFLGLVVGLNVAVRYPELLNTQAFFTPDKWILGGIAVVVMLEATRRIAGWALVGIVSFFVLYAHFANFFPGIFYSNPIPWKRLFTYLYLDTNSLLGLPLWVVVSVVLAYIFLGQALFSTGGGEFFMDFSLSAMGRFRGGTAKMAIFASSLFGTISGSAVANVVATGSITIPMMKKSGYPSRLAGAIEAVTSTGGQLMPPVMGATAFLIADFLGIAYAKVAMAAVIPALLYYLILFLQVDLEAAKLGMKGLPAAQLPSLGRVMRRSWLFLPTLAVLIYTLFWLRWDAGKAGFFTSAVLLALAGFRKQTRPSLKRFLDLCAKTGKGLLEIGVVAGVAGFVIGVLNVSGLGFGLSLGLVELAGHNVFPLLLLTAGISIILGMGMPTAAVYLLLVGLVTPALTQVGVPEIAAHFFIFYLGMMSMVTPPVCLATYAAAAIAESDFWHTGVAAMRFGAIAYLVPFLFVYSPTLLLVGHLHHIFYDVTTAIAGTGVLATALAGYLFRPLSVGKRLLAALAGFGLMAPTGLVGELWLPATIFGVGLFSLIVATQWVTARREKLTASPAAGLRQPVSPGQAGTRSEGESV